MLVMGFSLMNGILEPRETNVNTSDWVNLDHL